MKIIEKEIPIFKKKERIINTIQIKILGKFNFLNNFKEISLIFFFFTLTNPIRRFFYKKKNYVFLVCSSDYSRVRLPLKREFKTSFLFLKNIRKKLFKLKIVEKKNY